MEYFTTALTAEQGWKVTKMTKAEIIDYLYTNNVRGDFSIEQMAEDLDRPQGEWIPNHDGSWNCSECGLRVFIYAKGNYCPNCGARMKGADDE